METLPPPTVTSRMPPAPLARESEVKLDELVIVKDEPDTEIKGTALVLIVSNETDDKVSAPAVVEMKAEVSGVIPADPVKEMAESFTVAVDALVTKVPDVTLTVIFFISAVPDDSALVTLNPVPSTVTAAPVFVLPLIVSCLVIDPAMSVDVYAPSSRVIVV